MQPDTLSLVEALRRQDFDGAPVKDPDDLTGEIRAESYRCEE